MDTRFDGSIAGIGTTGGLRAVVGHWPRSPFGAFTDVMVERPDGHRVLLAPTREVTDFVAATYRFDEVRVVPVTARHRPEKAHSPSETARSRPRARGRGAVLEARAAAARPGRAAHVAHPAALHPLLRRLGATLADPAALLDHPAVRTAVERFVDDADAGLDTLPPAAAVLGLVRDQAVRNCRTAAWPTSCARCPFRWSEPMTGQDR